MSDHTSHAAVEPHDAVDVIRAKRDGGAVDEDALRWMIDAYTRGYVSDAQMSAFTMAILLNGMERDEIRVMTDAMIASGERMSFSGLGKLTVDKTPYDLMRTTFPAGTLTGAPKIRAMQIISEFEQTTRGPYGGTVGYFSFNGNLDCCITIRTAMLKDGKAYVQAGGGWVNDSVPENEFQETVNKAKAMINAVALAEHCVSGG